MVKTSLIMSLLVLSFFNFAAASEMSCGLVKNLEISKRDKASWVELELVRPSSLLKNRFVGLADRELNFLSLAQMNRRNVCALYTDTVQAGGIVVEIERSFQLMQ